MTAARARAFLGIASAILLAALFLASWFYLTPEGYDAFDGRPLGYDLDYARSYLGALDAEAKAFYLGPVRWLDTAFPIVFAAFLAMMLHRATAHWALVPQLLIMLAPGGYLVMDLAENALVAGLLTTELSDLRAAQVSLASHFTITKYVILGVTVAAIGLLSIGAKR